MMLALTGFGGFVCNVLAVVVVAALVLFVFDQFQ